MAAAAAVVAAATAVAATVVRGGICATSRRSHGQPRGDRARPDLLRMHGLGRAWGGLTSCY